MTRWPGAWQLMRVMLIVAGLLAALIAAWLSPRPAALAPTEAAVATQHAWTWLWAGVSARGDLRSFDAGLAAADQAARLGADPVAIEAVREALRAQRALAEVTLRGQFPMSFFLSPSLLLDAEALGSYELVDDAPDVAATLMAEALRDELMGAWHEPLQLSVLVVSQPRAPSLEHKILFLLEEQPRLALRTLDEAASRLDPQDARALREGRAEQVRGDLARQLGADRLIVLEIAALDQVDDVHAYALRGHLWERDASGPKPLAMNQRQFIRDRNDRLPVLLWMMLSLALVGVGMGVARAGDRVGGREALALGSLAFAVSAVSAPLLMRFLASVQPLSYELLMVAFWWPVLAGVALALGPALLWSTLSRRLGAVSPLMRRAQEVGDAMAWPVGAGGALYLTRAAVVYEVRWGWALSVAALLVGVAASTLVAHARAGQRLRPQGWLALIAGLLLTAPLLMMGQTLGALALGALALWGATRGRVPGDSASEVTSESGAQVEGEALDALVQRARRPALLTSQALEQARALCGLDDDAAPRASWLWLHGPQGCGKSTTAQALVSQWQARGALVLQGACAPPANEDVEQDGDGHEARPFAVFAQAFGGVGVLGAEHGPQGMIDELESGVLEALPLVAMLLPAGDASSRQMVSDRGELHARVMRDLQVRTRGDKRPVVLWLDDIQWLDNASQSLIGALLARYPAGASSPLIFILSGRALPIGSPLSQEHQRALHRRSVEASLTQLERHALLTQHIGFDDASASLLAEGATQAQGAANLAWLLALVEEVARAGCVASEEEDAAAKARFRLTVSRVEELPLPRSFTLLAERAFAALEPASREVLRAATCLGASFEVELLSRALSWDRLRVIETLETIAARTGLIEDVVEEDDLFRFVSTQHYAALRDHLGLQDMHPRARSSQLARDLHLRMARVLEAMHDEGHAPVSRVANHYYNAGRRDLGAALRYCRQAARAAIGVFAHDNAEFYLRRAQICAELMVAAASDEAARASARAALDALSLEQRLLPFERAHVLGLRELQEQQADEAQVQLQRWDATQAPPPLSLQICMARALYEGRRYEDALRVAHRLAELEVMRGVATRAQRAERQLARIEGMHFVGVSLPFDQPHERLRWLEQAREAIDALAAPGAESGVEVQTLGEPARDSAAGERAPVLALAARIYNSLAEQRAAPVTFDLALATRCFERSIALKRALNPPDKPGLARSYGGLGRLHLLMARQQDAQDQARAFARQARGYLEQDLALCRDYGDVHGECQMLSHLGECALRLGDPDGAVTHYQGSLALTSAPEARGFALAGLLRAHVARGDSAQVLATVATIDTGYDERALARLSAGVKHTLRAALSEARLDTAHEACVDAMLRRLDAPSTPMSDEAVAS